MKVGLIARADNGGLGNQTWEVWRHMRPERVLVVHAHHQTRGFAEPSRYVDSDTTVRVTARMPTQADARWLCSGVDTIFTAETWGGSQVPRYARQRGIRTVIQANPEFFTEDEMATVVVAPSEWELRRLPRGTSVLRMPVNRDLLPRRSHGEPTDELSHVTSHAMCDRNGTDLLLEALRHLRTPVRLTILGGERRTQRMSGSVVEWLGHDQRPYYEAWESMTGVFVLPRRFGGLCLPMQEAASLGLPIVTLQVSPQTHWSVKLGVARATVKSREWMRGGVFDVYQCSPRELARQIDLARGREGARMSDSGVKWAESLSWRVMKSAWDAVLRPA